MANYAIIVDLETTGLDSGRDQIIEIGAIKVDLDTGEVIDQFQTLTKPDDVYGFFDDEDEDIEDSDVEPDRLDPFIVELTGITDEMLEGAPSNPEAVEAFFQFAGDLQIWAYNAGFDSKFLNNHTEEHRPLKDVLALARRAFPELENHKLSTVAQQLNVSVEGAHRAIADCLITKEVLLRGIKYQIENPHPFHHGFKASDYLPKEEGIFFGKIIVFTGALVTMTRDGAATHASQFGFKIGSSVTKKTNYLVVGIQDLTTLAGHDKSTKQRKAEELIAEGVKIEILTENDFIKMCGIAT
ncbi:exonuclease domain-containing protein [Polynucleobacter sp. MWH-Aus1W21]|uniref:exonuclease domain-containing protein n=1 Tax=Polynucleobacter sp. MWH-Aus1W21 TaxID=1855880 RepID=UPI001BFDDD57|nr:exonuclease domain-containing protein [Polynucleobacter sp. MWH-Aus1W21]QWD65925.1 3'-5' exoribonuclease [Polynucleobacter sp. MWH-Aus1W21]